MLLKGIFGAHEERVWQSTPSLSAAQTCLHLAQPCSADRKYAVHHCATDGNLRWPKVRRVRTQSSAVTRTSAAGRLKACWASFRHMGSLDVGLPCKLKVLSLCHVLLALTMPSLCHRIRSLTSRSCNFATLCSSSWRRTACSHVATT